MSNTHPLELTHEGTSLVGQLIHPEQTSGKRPAVLVVPDAMGLSPFYVAKARQLADLGYVALAADMYGNGFYSDIPEDAGNHYLVFHQNPSLMRARVLAWYEKLTSLPEVDPTRVAAIGYCFGGQCMLELARSGCSVKAVVSYHGLLTTHQPAEPDAISGLVVVYTGNRDPYVPQEHIDGLRKEMATANARLYLTEFSDAYHAFTNPKPPRGVESGMQYNALCDKLSWTGTLATLEQVLGQ